MIHNESIVEVHNHSVQRLTPKDASPLYGIYTRRFFGKLKKLILGKEKKQEYNNKLQKVYSSIFAPSEIKRNDYMMVQVFFIRKEMNVMSHARQMRLIQMQNVRIILLYL